MYVVYVVLLRVAWGFVFAAALVALALCASFVLARCIGHLPTIRIAPISCIALVSVERCSNLC